MTAMVPARSDGAARLLSVRNAPRKDRPNPAPAMALPQANSAKDPAVIAAKVSPTPTNKAAQPYSMAGRAAAFLARTTATPPQPHKRKMTRPPHSRLPDPTMLAASPGPRDR